MKKPSLEAIVLRHTLPNPKANDPTTFFGHVQRNLVHEVRHEVQVFYGSLDCLEAQYPGLDYTYPPHRRRLSRYTWHRRLFRTFDELRLTDHEILSLCQWEGTRSAKERYEAETKVKIRDTTFDDVVAAPVSEGPRCYVYNWTEPMEYSTSYKALRSAQVNSDAEAEQSDEDDMASSIGVQLNQQLLEAAEARSRGEVTTVDPQWEQWMKEALERDEFDRDSIIQAIREGRPLSDLSTSPSPTRNGLSTLRLSAETNALLQAGSMSHPRIAERYDDLRSMLSDLQAANNQLATDNAQLAMLLTRTLPETAR